MKNLLMVFIVLMIAGVAYGQDEDCIVRQGESCWYDVGCDIETVYLIINDDNGFNLSSNFVEGTDYISIAVSDGRVNLGEWVNCDIVTPIEKVSFSTLKTIYNQ